MPKGLLITFSGLDGAGKSTQIDLLMDRLRAGGHDPVYLWTRGGYTALFERLKSLLRRLPGRAMPPAGPNPARAQAFRKGWVRRAWLVLALLELIWVYGLQIRWWQVRGRDVVCDRYLWDTLIDFRLNYSEERVESWWLWFILARVAPQPDVAFLMLVPVEESVQRSDLKGEPFRDPPAVLAERLVQYQTMAQGSRWTVLNGQCSKIELAEVIYRRVKASRMTSML